MWVLSSPGTQLGGIRRWLRPDHTYSLGRRSDADIRVEGKSVSRDHLTLAVGPGPRSRLTVTNLRTLGTIVNTSKLNDLAVAVFGPDASPITIEVGKTRGKDTTVVVTWVAVEVAVSSSVSAAHSSWQTRLAPLGIKLSSELSSHTTVYVKGATNTSKTATALARALPVVTAQYLDAIVKAAPALERDFDAHWPDPVQFAADPLYLPDPRRSKLLTGRIFMFVHASLYMQLCDMISAAGGRSIVYDVDEHETGASVTTPDAVARLERFCTRHRSSDELLFVRANEKDTEMSTAKKGQITDDDRLRLAMAAARSLGTIVVAAPLFVQVLLDVNPSLLKASSAAAMPSMLVSSFAQSAPPRGRKRPRPVAIDVMSQFSVEKKGKVEKGPEKIEIREKVNEISQEVNGVSEKVNEVPESIPDAPESVPGAPESIPDAPESVLESVPEPSQNQDLPRRKRIRYHNTAALLSQPLSQPQKRPLAPEVPIAPIDMQAENQPEAEPEAEPPFDPLEDISGLRNLALVAPMPTTRPRPIAEPALRDAGVQNYKRFVKAWPGRLSSGLPEVSSHTIAFVNAADMTRVDRMQQVVDTMFGGAKRPATGTSGPTTKRARTKSKSEQEESLFVGDPDIELYDSDDAGAQQVQTIDYDDDDELQFRFTRRELRN